MQARRTYPATMPLSQAPARLVCTLGQCKPYPSENQTLSRISHNHGAIGKTKLTSIILHPKEIPPSDTLRSHEKAIRSGGCCCPAARCHFAAICGQQSALCRAPVTGQGIPRHNRTLEGNEGEVSWTFISDCVYETIANTCGRLDAPHGRR